MKSKLREGGAGDLNVYTVAYVLEWSSALLGI
jgi:hypothetical protein